MEKILDHTLKLMERSAVGFELTGLIVLFRLMFQVIEDSSLLMVAVLGSATIVPELLMLRLPKVVRWFWNYANQRYAICCAIRDNELINHYLNWLNYDPWYEDVHVSNICIMILGVFAMNSQHEKACLIAYFAIPVGILMLWWLVGSYYWFACQPHSKVKVTRGTIQIQDTQKRVRILPYCYRRNESDWTWVDVSDLDLSRR